MRPSTVLDIRFVYRIEQNRYLSLSAFMDLEFWHKRQTLNKETNENIMSYHDKCYEKNKGGQWDKGG